MADALLERVRVEYDDEDLRFRVQNFLSTRQFPKLRDVQIQAKNGAVSITAKANSFYEKQVALNSCRRVAGVLSIVDGIEVAEGYRTEVEDLAAKDNWDDYPLYTDFARS